MKLKSISVNYDKCKTPYACKKCLKYCPQAVMMVQAVKVEKFKETNENEPDAFRVRARYADRCTGCNICVEVCPVNAITLEYY